MENLMKDVRYAVKLLAKQRGFTAAALLTLALCIGANTAMFSVVRSVLLKPLPFRDGQDIVYMTNSYPGAGIERASTGIPDYYDRIERTTVFSHLALLQSRGMTIGEPGRPERITGMAVTPSLFPLLFTDAAHGRTFTPEEGEPGAARVALISHGMWQEQYAGARDVLGKTIRINEVAHEIVGVMPRGFAFHQPDARVWVPLAFTPEQRADDRRHSNSWEMVGRLKPGATVAQAQRELDQINAQNDERFPQFREVLRKAGYRSIAANYQEDLTRDVRSTLWLLQGGVLFVLLIGCVNIANLILVRATSRHRELATRSALGAAHVRLVRQLMTESLVLAILGGALGVALGWLGMRTFATIAGDELPRATEITLDATVMLAALGVSVVVGLLFGVIPVARLLRGDMSSVFREEGRTGTATHRTHALRGALVVAQVSLAFALLIGAGLMISSFARTLAVDTGFEPDQLLTASVALPGARYSDADAQRQFHARLLERMRAIPGVQHAAAANMLLFGDDFNSSVVTPEGYTPQPEESLIAPINSAVSDDYFETMGIDVISGRSFTAGDVATAPPVAIIDQTLAERFFAGQDPLGRRITQGAPGLGEDDELLYRTIVGVVRHVRAQNLIGDQPPGHYYIPLAQEPDGQIHVTLRASIPLDAATTALRTAVTAIDPELPVHNVLSMEERIAASVTTDRVRTLLLLAFAALALFLAALGLYGVLSYSVAQRSAEIGIRMALGCSSSDVFRMVLGQGARLMVIGLGVGVLASVALARGVRDMLYGVAPIDPIVYSGVLALLSLTAVIACIVPARRATRVDPLVAIREVA
jgi:predicted permease